MPVDTTQVKLSGSTDGKPILIVATTTAGTAIHTATASTTTEWDEVWLYATNNHTGSVLLTIEFGGTTVAFQKQVTIPPKSGEQLVIPGFRVQNACAIAAFAGTTNVIAITGHVNRHVNS
jgi:hypothetical protein